MAPYAGPYNFGWAKMGGFPMFKKKKEEAPRPRFRGARKSHTINDYLTPSTDRV